MNSWLAWCWDGNLITAALTVDVISQSLANALCTHTWIPVRIIQQPKFLRKSEVQFSTLCLGLSHSRW
jgi:hypothetical protein